jgi:hypothetical protein
MQFGITFKTDSPETFPYLASQCFDTGSDVTNWIFDVVQGPGIPADRRMGQSLFTVADQKLIGAMLEGACNVCVLLACVLHYDSEHTP